MTQAACAGSGPVGTWRAMAAGCQLRKGASQLSSPNVPRFAPGGPGIEPRWTRGTKVAVGTAYSTSSSVWYTLDDSCVTEVYSPTIDSAQIRDLQFLVTDAETFFHDERRNFVGASDCIPEA